MKSSPLLRAGGYLFCSLCGMIVGGYLPTPFAELLHLLFVFFCVFVESRLSKIQKTTTFSLQNKAKTFLLFPIFFAATLGANLLSAKITLLLGGNVPTVTPSLPLFVGAVLLAPLAEELLFRHLLISLFSPYGKTKAVLLSALFFALAHGNFFQMPYAFIAGCLLCAAAIVGNSVLFPVLFHLLYNLAAFFGNAQANLILLIIFGVLSLPAAYFLCRKMPRRQPGKQLPRAEISLLLLFGAVMLVFSVFRLL